MDENAFFFSSKSQITDDKSSITFPSSSSMLVFCFQSNTMKTSFVFYFLG